MALRTRVVVAAAALALLLALPAGALAIGWTAQQTVNTAQGRTVQPPTLRLGVDGAGNAFLSLIADKSPQGAQVAERPVGQGWNPTQELGAISSPGNTPTLAVDTAGNAVVAYSDSAIVGGCTAGTANSCLRLWFKPAGSSTWINESSTPSPGGGAIGSIAVALDPRANGAAAVVWRTTPSANVYRVSGVRRAAAGGWSGVSTLWNNNTEIPSQISLGIDGAGRPIVIWSTIGVAGTCPCGVRQSTDFDDATVTGATLVPATAGSAVTPLSLGVDSAGNVAAMWVFTVPGAGRVVRTATLPPGGGFGPSEDVASAAATTNVVGPQLVRAADGEAVATVMFDVTGGTVARQVVAVTKPAGGTWGTPTTLDPDTVDPSAPALTIDAAGNAAAVWHNGSTASVRYATHKHGDGAFGGTFDGPSIGAGQIPVFAASDAAGNVHVAWSSGNGSAGTGVLDTAAPALALGNLPAAAFAPGVPVSFTATTSDTWGSPVTTSWDFGDGQTSTGLAPTHAFATPGTYIARATATDANGNSASQTRTVVISATAAPGVPRPLAGKTVNLEPVGGTVLVKVPGTTKYVPLVAPTQVRTGSIIDTRKGRVRITIDNGRGGLDTAEFYGGIFKFTQPKVKAGQRRFADLFLFGGNFKGCPAAPRDPKLASLSAKKGKHGSKASPNRSVRQLWGSGEGAFRTVGRFSSATVRGTTWLTDDHCNGTLTKVTAGKVGVRDFVLKKTVVIKKGKTYFAKPRKKR